MTQVDHDVRLPLVLLAERPVPLTVAAEGVAGDGQSTSCSEPESTRTLCVAAGQRLTFQVSLRADEEVSWAGAREHCFGLRWSRAVACPTQAGPHRVVAEIFGNDGRLRRAASCLLEVV